MNYLHKGDIPSNLLNNGDLDGDLAIDTETTGLNLLNRDRLCLVQVSNGNGNAHLVKFERGIYDCPNLVKILANDDIQKIFHYARFDILAIKKFLGVTLQNIFCTKIASRLCRTYTDKHGLKELCKEYLGSELSKRQQTSYWGAEWLTKDQIKYAANDVLFLHKIREKITWQLKNEDRLEIALKCFDFLQTRMELDEIGYEPVDIFAHS